MKPKKKNPADLTLRNLRALKKRVERLELHVSMCHEAIQTLASRTCREAEEADDVMECFRVKK